MGTKDFNIVIVAQAGRLQYEAVLFLSSLRQNSPLFKGKVFVAEPIQGPLWQKDPKISSEGCREALHHLGATLISFENKILEALILTETKLNVSRSCRQMNLLCFLTPIH